MNHVEYTLFVQRIFIAATGLSFITMSMILVFLNPYENDLYVWGLLLMLLLFLTGLISLTAFWWFFSIRKEILEIPQVNQILYQSLISSMVIVFVMVLNQTNQLNIWTVGVVLLSYLFYWIWSLSG